MYAKINWTSTMLLTPARFRQMETQYDEVIDYWDANPFRVLSTMEISVEARSTEPAPQMGRLYYNTSTAEEILYVSDGTTWTGLNLG